MLTKRHMNNLFLASDGRFRQVPPIWWRREWYPIRKHFRVLDCEDTYDSEDFFKVDVTVGHGFFEYINPNAARRYHYLRQARLKAEALVRQIETIKRNAAWRKRLMRAKNEFDFVWEPYAQALKKEYGWQWRYEFAAKQAATYERVWARMRELCWIKQQAEIEAARQQQESKFQKQLNIKIQQRERGWQRGLHFPQVGELDFGSYGPADRARDLKVIENGMKWVESFDNVYFTRIMVKIMDEQGDIRKQVDLIARTRQAAEDGRLQEALEQLMKMAGHPYAHASA